MSDSANVGRVFNLTGGGSGSGSLKLVGISVKTPPKKTTYKSGESFEPDGMVIEADYGYGLTSEVTGYSVSPSVLTDGVTEVTITYTEGRVTKSTTTPVTVEKVLTAIKVTNSPSKMTYKYLEKFDPNGMIVTATYSDGSSSPVTGYTYPTTQFTTLGDKTIELSYTYEGVEKTTSLQVTVVAIEVPVPAQRDTITYNGEMKTPVWDANYDASKMSFSGETTGANAGNYTVTFELNYGYVFPNGTSRVSVDWVIDRAVIAALPTQSNVLVADSTQKTPEWNGYVVGQLTMTGELFGIEARDYTVTFIPTGNYKWWDGSIEGKEAKWTITSVMVTIPVQKNVPVYDGAAKTPEWDNFDQENSTVQVTPQTNAGDSYTATFTLLRGMWSDGETGPKTITWKIEKATLAAVPKQTGTLTYDGNPKTPSWDANYDPNKMTVSVESKVNAGTDYTASFTPDSNHKWWDDTTGAKTATWVINKGTYTATVSPTSIVLNMNAKSASFTVSRKENGTITAQSSNTGVATVSVNQASGVVTVNSVNDTSGDAEITVKVGDTANYLAPADIKVPVKASFREYLYGYDMKISDTNPATRVSYPADVDNAGFAAAAMGSSAFSYGGWPSTPGEKFMPRPCMQLFSGAVGYYLNPNNYTQKADGSSSDVANVNYGGNAMMEWPKIYVKRWEEGGVYHFRCSDVKVDSDYECWSNYDKNNKEIDHFYTPIFFGSKDSSGRLRSISGQANWVSTGGAQNEINAAKLNGEDIWYTEVVADRFLEQDLLVMMFKSTDLQTALGNGVSSGSAVAPGTLNDKGMFWGTTANKTTGVKAFGMEHLWANLWRRTAGWINANGTQKFKLTRGTKDGTTVADYNLDGSGYLTVSGATPSGSSGGYISSCVTQKFGRVPAVASGASTTNECDGMWFNNSQVDYAYVGGSYSNDLYCGPFAVALYLTASDSSAYGGAALSCKPLAAA